MQRVQSPIIPVVGELIRNNPGTISLGQGVVNYAPPEKSREYIERFYSDPGNHKYQMVDGIPELVELIAEKSKNENQIDLSDERRIVVTAGGNMAFLNAILAIADPDDEIIHLVPYYFNHEMAVTIAGCKPVCVATDDSYQPRIEAIEAAINERTRGIVTISPNNPTGVVYPEATIQKISAICRRYGIYHIHDEAYEYFTYDGERHYSPASDPSTANYTISLFSLSKAYAFASWRIGWMIIPTELFENIRKIQDTNLICPPVISQWAAAGALAAGRSYCDNHISALASVRSMVLSKLEALSDIAEGPRATGAFYVLLRLRTSMSDMEVVERLIREYRVAAIPGSTFGIEEGCYLRIAYGALDEASVEDGIQRLVGGLRAICG